VPRCSLLRARLRPERRGRLTSPGVPPVGTGSWVSNGLPIAQGNFAAWAFFLATPDVFRSALPPAFGGTAYEAALAEVHDLAVNRTLEQLALARFWHVNQSPFRNSVMNGLAFDLIREHRPKDARPRAS
jgi:hypothetical protein